MDDYEIWLAPDHTGGSVFKVERRAVPLCRVKTSTPPLAQLDSGSVWVDDSRESNLPYHHEILRAAETRDCQDFGWETETTRFSWDTFIMPRGRMTDKQRVNQVIRGWNFRSILLLHADAVHRLPHRVWNPFQLYPETMLRYPEHAWEGSLDARMCAWMSAAVTELCAPEGVAPSSFGDDTRIVFSGGVPALVSRMRYPDKILNDRHTVLARQASTMGYCTELQIERKAWLEEIPASCGERTKTIEALMLMYFH